MTQPLWKTILQILLKLNIFLPHNSNNCALWYLPKWVENLCSHKNLHVILVAALFTISKTGKQLRSLSTAEWINKLWYIHMIEYFSTIKKKKKRANARVQLQQPGNQPEGVRGVGEQCCSLWLEDGATCLFQASGFLSYFDKRIRPEVWHFQFPPRRFTVSRNHCCPTNRVPA